MGGAGVAPGARVQPVRAVGKCGGYTSDIADAIVWAAGGSVPGVPANPTPARVINLSLGGPGACALTTRFAIDAARSRGSVVVVAAGNDGADAGDYSPASCQGVISVGAVGRGGARAYYSNHGATVDVSAPGGDRRVDPIGGGIYSTFNTGTRAPGDDTHAYRQGTSMAAPHVAGVVALMLARNPGLTPEAVEAHLKASARPLPVPCSLGCGSGIVDARAAVQAAIDAAGPHSPRPVLPPRVDGVAASPQPAQAVPEPPAEQRPPPSRTPPAPPLPPPSPAPAPAPAPARTIREVEPNDTLRTAQRVEAPATIEGTLSSPGDTDYYSVVVAPGLRIEAALVCGGSADYDLHAYDSAGRLVASSRMGPGKIDSVTLDNSAGSQPVRATLRVVHYSGGVGPRAGRYSLGLRQGGN
jgi:serine protease